MLETTQKATTIQDIALNLVQEQRKNQMTMTGDKERTIFVLGSKGVVSLILILNNCVFSSISLKGKSTIINTFLDRSEPTKPTLALEYSFGRRSGSAGHDIHKQICNIWELGSLSNLHNLIDIPLKSHGLTNMNVVIVLDLSQPDRLWIDLEGALDGLKQSIKNHKSDELNELKNAMKKLIGEEHSDLDTLEIFPVPVLIVGGNYDKFQDFGKTPQYLSVNTFFLVCSFFGFVDPEIKKHVCRCLRSISHTIGAALIYYSMKNASLSKTLRETLNHFGFGSPTKPFRTLATDYNGPLCIWYGQDSWKAIGVTPTNSERIGLTYSTQIPQTEITDDPVQNDPTKDAGFREAIIDEIRAQKDEELMRLIKDTEIRAKFQAVAM